MTKFTGLGDYCLFGPYMTPGDYKSRFTISDRFGGLYLDRSGISGEILQKISKGLYFKHNIVKKLIARRFQ